MAATESLPPRLSVGPIAWVRKNFFSTWYNTLLTLLAIGILYSLLSPALSWALSEAKWGVIKANLTLFMVGQYPRDQLWRIMLIVGIFSALMGFSWGTWGKAARAFALIFLGASIFFGFISLLLEFDGWYEWFIMSTALLAFYYIGRYLPRAKVIAGIWWFLFFPIGLLLIAGSKYIPPLPPVELNLWGGFTLTLILAITGNIGALPLGILLALGRRSKLPAIKYFCIGYIELIRGVPLITVLYMADILLPLFLPVDVRPDRVIRAIVGFILFEAAYQAENVRGGLQSIPNGQYEAANALGLNNSLTTVLIILPQALRAVIPALFNSFISLFKDTSLVAIIGLFEILRIGRSVLAQSDWLGTYREVFLFVFMVFWLFNLAFSYGNKRVEEALGIGKR